MKTKQLTVALTLGLGLTLALMWLIATPLRAAPASPAATCTVDDSGGADYTTIQAAVNDATCEVITVAAGSYGENIVITRSVTLIGAGSGSTLVGDPYLGQVFRIDVEDAEVSISGMQISGYYDTQDGTGIYNTGTLTLTEVLVTQNETTEDGGGIYNYGNLIVLSSTIAGNFAVNGGGIYHWPASTDKYLLIEHSTIAGNVAYESGGGIANINRRVTIRDSVISGNEAYDSGGGIYYMPGVTEYGSVTIEDSQILDNSAGDLSYYYGAGGAMYSAGHVTMTNSTVQGNEAGLMGGGIFVTGSGNVRLEDCTVSGNEAHSGGGLFGYTTASTLQVVRCEISDNSVSGYGGGIYSQSDLYIETSSVFNNVAGQNGGGINSSGTIWMASSTVNDNSAGRNGGGIAHNASDAMTLTNVTVSGNSADRDGGGIYAAALECLDSVTIADNTADADGDGSGDGGGIMENFGSVWVKNTLIAENHDSSPTTVHPDCSGGFTTLGHNLVGDNSGCTGFVSVYDQYGSSVAPLDPYLSPLGDYGGPTLVHALQYTSRFKSPAVDAGITGGCPSTDQRGMARPFDGDGDGNAVCDIGAYEYGASLALPDLEIVKAVNPGTAAPGEPITYTLAFSNTGSEAATGVIITDSIPVSITDTTFSDSGAALTAVDGTRYVWQVEDMTPGASGLITVTGLLQTPLAPGTFTNTASIGADDDEDWSNNSSSVGIMVQDAPPVASDATFYTDEHDPVEGDLEAGEPNGEPLHYAIWIGGNPDYGAVFIADDGGFVYTPTNRTTNYSDTFRYTAYTDDCANPATCADSDWAEVTLHITATNDAPGISNIANQKTSVGVSVGPIPFSVSDPDTPLASLTLSRASSNTTLVPLANITFGGSGAARTVAVTPAAGLSGTALITVTVSDSVSSAYDVFALIVGTGNVPPDFTSTPIKQATEDAAYTYAITTTDLDAGDVLTITAPTRPAWLMLVDHHDRTATLGGTPTNANVGSHAVVLQVVDSAGAASTQAFTITVHNVNDPPIAHNDAPTTDEDIPINIPVLANDSDVDNDPLSIVAVGAPNYGSVTVSRTSDISDSVVYTPANQATAYDAVFTYTISDGCLYDTATVTVAVAANNDPPIISDIADQGTYMGLRVGPLPFTVSDLDTPASTLTLDKASSDTTLVPLANIAFGGSGPNRAVTITPTAGLSGAAIITITVSDGVSSAYDIFLLTVEGNSTPAFASTPSTAATQNVAYTYPITTTDANVWDVLTITAVTKPGWLALVDHHDRTATLGGVPADVHVGSHPVTLRVTDSHGATATQSFTITVANVNDPPRARDDNAATSELTPVSVNVLSNDSDLDGDTVALVAVGVPLFGSAAISGNAVVYTPANRSGNYNAVFTYTISDGTLNDTGSVIVAVTALDGPPFISNVLNQRTSPGVPVGPLSFTVSDPDTPVGALTLQKASSNHGLVPLPNIAFGGSGANRTVTITPTAAMTGTAIVTITVRDGTSARRDTFVLTVGVLNSPPEFNSTPVTTATASAPYAYAITATDLDAGDLLTITAPTCPDWLALTQVTSRTATLNGTAASAGDYLVVLQVQDSAGAIGTQVFTVTVGVTGYEVYLPLVVRNY
ncbi:MAG: tandem-95 repeat protein [Anaerolineae bacterium]|nr:tandem-95 repeat protein [Anaerolineae bacterium]